MNYARSVLFYTVIGIFTATAVVTLLGITGVVAIPDTYLNALFAALLIELVAAVVGLFKVTDWFGADQLGGELERIEGGWWQALRSEQRNALSFVRLSESDQRKQLVLQGEAYSATGAPHAQWWSIAASLNPSTWEIHYFWRGDHTGEDSDFSGIGYFRFEHPVDSKPVTRATGWFTQGNIEQLMVTARTKVEMMRASPEDARTMNGRDLAAKSALVASVAESWKHVPSPSVAAGS